MAPVGVEGVILAFMVLMGALFVIWTIRRLHDIDKSGWFVILVVLLLPLLPLLCLVPGTKGSNRYGQIPKTNSAWEKCLGYPSLVLLLTAFFGGVVMITFNLLIELFFISYYLSNLSYLSELLSA